MCAGVSASTILSKRKKQYETGPGCRDEVAADRNEDFVTILGFDWEQSTGLDSIHSAFVFPAIRFSALGGRYLSFTFSI